MTQGTKLDVLEKGRGVHEQSRTAQNVVIDRINDNIDTSAQRSNEISALQNRVLELHAESVKIAPEAYEEKEPDAAARAASLESEIFQSNRLIEAKQNEIIQLADELILDKIRLEELKELEANRKMRNLGRQIQKDLDAVTHQFADLVLNIQNLAEICGEADAISEQYHKKDMGNLGWNNLSRFFLPKILGNLLYKYALVNMERHGGLAQTRGMSREWLTQFENTEQGRIMLNNVVNVPTNSRAQ